MEQSRKRSWIPIVFGLPFIGAGAFFALTGFEVYPLPGDRPNAPLWVIGCVGVAFLASGLLVSGAGILGWIRNVQRGDIECMFPDEPWLSDYPWDRDGIRSAGLGGVVGGIFGLAFFCAFLAPFHWWAWLSREGGVMVRVIVSIFELCAGLFAYAVLRMLAQWLKYGRTQLRFKRFPFHPGERLEVEFSPNLFERLEVTLRFVMRVAERTGSGDNRSSRIRTETIRELNRIVECSALDAEVSIAFDLPDEPTLVNRISEQPSYYWEMEIKAEASGVDFDEAFKLPVYAAPRPSGTRAAAATSSRRGAMLITD